MSKIKLLADDPGLGDLVKSIASRGAGKVAGRKPDKGVRPFNDVLGVVTKSIRAGTNTRPSMDDVTLRMPSISFKDAFRPKGDAVRSEPAEGGDDDYPASSPAAVDEMSAGARTIGQPSTPDPARMMVLAADIRHAVDAHLSGASSRDGGMALSATDPPLARRGGPVLSATADPDDPHGARRDGTVAPASGLSNRAPEDDTAIEPTAPSQATPATAGPVAWSEIGPDQETVQRVSIKRLDAPAARVEVVQQQTHFAPVATIAPVQQIGTAIATELSAGSAGVAAADRAGPIDPTAADTRPVRVLTIRLDPPNLGEVTVSMRLQGDALELHLSASQHDTLAMLRQNREALHDLMRESGYVADVASIQMASGDAGMATTTGHGQQTSPGQGQQDAADRAAAGREASRDGDGTQGSRSDRQQSGRRDQEEGAADDTAHRPGGSIYL